MLVSRRWLGALAVALAFAAAAYFLGRWQWHRYEDKAARAQRIHAHYDAAPRPLDQVLRPAPVPLSREWTRVVMHGRYAVSQTLLVRNRPYNGTYGYEVLVPFTDATGAGVLIDRGWVENAQNAQTLPRFPAAPAGPVTVTGWVRQSEPNLGRDLPHGQLASIDVSEASRTTGMSLLGGYVVLQGERLPNGTVPARPTPLQPPETDLGPHQAYAFQWWAAMVGGVVLVLFGARREARELREGAAPGVPRPAKVRIWDEEDG